MKLIESISKRIKQILKERNLTQYQLYKLSGVPQSTISTIINGETKDIKISTIYNICSALNIELSEFFDKDSLKIKSIND